MQRLREVLRLRFELHMGHQQIGRSCAIGVSTLDVASYGILSIITALEFIQYQLS